MRFACAHVAKQVDAGALNPPVERRAGSSPVMGTNILKHAWIRTSIDILEYAWMVELVYALALEANGRNPLGVQAPSMYQSVPVA